MTKGIIYYTDNRLAEPIFRVVQNQILKANIPITSVSLKPIKFGDNTVLNLEPSYQTMITQIVTALEEAKEDVVFFTEHDVLYPLSHFEFTPPKDNLFYYNSNIYRWKYLTNHLVTYDRLLCLSTLCVNRKFALEHYQKRLKKIGSIDWSQDKREEPRLARLWGYEPGTKKIRRGGFSDDDFDTWKSKEPIIDIRHGKTFSLSKVTKGAFTHLPTNWQETTIDKIDGWDLKDLFKQP